MNKISSQISLGINNLSIEKINDNGWFKCEFLFKGKLPAEIEYKITSLFIEKKAD